jgi:hypothetical protein
VSYVLLGCRIDTQATISPSSSAIIIFHDKWLSELISMGGVAQTGSRVTMAGRHMAMLSLSMRILWLNVSYAVVLISSSSGVLDMVSEGKRMHDRVLTGPCLWACRDRLYPVSTIRT